jgi:hypothetical protein
MRALWRKGIEKLRNKVNTFEFLPGYLYQVSKSILYKQQTGYFRPVSAYILLKLLDYLVENSLSLLLATSLVILPSFLKAL